MSNSAFLYQLITIIVFLIPVGALVWKAAKHASKIDEHEKRLAKLEETYQSDISEIKQSINQLNIEFTKSFTELATAINFIKEGLKR